MGETEVTEFAGEVVEEEKVVSYQGFIERSKLWLCIMGLSEME